jgi:hypothetical protein
MSRTVVVLCAALALGGVGCERQDEALRARQLASRALRNVLAYPQSSLVSVSAGENAAELVLTSPATVPVIVAWYRHTLEQNGWDVKSEQTRGDTVTLFAERRGEPVWITLRPNAGAAGTTYRLIGAILPDSAPPSAPAPPPARDSVR